MSEEANEDIGYFVYGIHVIKRPDGRVEYQDNYLNRDIPIEVVIMQLKAFLNNLEKEYLDKYGKKSKSSDE